MPLFYSLNEMLDFVKMFPANGGGGMGVCMSRSEFQNRAFLALRRKPCPCRYLNCLCPYLSLVAECRHFILHLPCVAVGEALSLVGIFLLPGHAKCSLPADVLWGSFVTHSFECVTAGRLR